MKKDNMDDADIDRVEYVVRDTASAVKMRKEEAKEAAQRYKAVVQKTREEAKLELAKLRLQMSAKEAASKHIAVFGPLYLLLLCGGFFAAIQYIPSTEIGVVSSILTLLITMIGANLRSIVAGENETSTAKKEEDTQKK